MLRPGWVRLNFKYFIDEAELEYIIRAIELVAEHGWRLLPFYHFDTRAGVWRYQQQQGQLKHSLNSLRFTDYSKQATPEPAPKLDLEGLIEAAQQELFSADPLSGTSELILSETAESLRWFVLPQEVAAA